MMLDLFDFQTDAKTIFWIKRQIQMQKEKSL